MYKKGPFGKAEQFYIEEKFKNGISAEEIANDLNRIVSSIEKHIKNKQIKRVSQKTIIEEQFVHHKGATIMTENASTMIDANRNPKIVNSNNCITKIKNV